MAQAEQYDVFLSYRRDGGVKDAMLIKSELEKRGLRVFLDMNALGAGEFDRQLYRRIDECKGFVLILTPNALERCKNEQDWVRLELEHARAKGKNIVPVLIDDFSFPENLPSSIEFVRHLHGPRSSMDYFDAFIDRLAKFLQSEPVMSPPPSVSLRQTTPPQSPLVLPKPRQPRKPAFVAGRDNVLMEDNVPRPLEHPKVFSTTLERRQISSITFLDSLADAPKNARDFSRNKNRSVLGWTRKSGDGLYDLYIAGEGGVSAPKNCNGLFRGYINVTSIDFNGAFHTDHVSSFWNMFKYCGKLTALNLSSFFTSNVTDMCGMFSWCEGLTTLDVSSFDTSNVTNMSCMFYACTRLKSLDVSNFDFSHVEECGGFMPDSLDPNWRRYFT